ncbi:MAG: 2-dehydropantoate 2-reductase [Geobacteraceae bacterium]|nr:2-dehydropantoate 2-reductase [Geobacteraceae bacterium]
MSHQIRQTAIIGAGALGATYASLLHSAVSGSVCFIAAGERYDHLLQHGVTVNGTTFNIPVRLPKEATPVDLLIVAVKHHHLDQAIRDMQQAIGPDTIILSVMNGIDSEDRIGAVYGMDRALYGLTLGIDAVRNDTSVTYTSLGKVLFGERENQTISNRATRVSNLFTKAGITHTIPEDMLRALWYKFMINVGVNQVSAVMGLTYGGIRNSGEAKKLMDSAMLEVISLAQTLQINLSEEDIGQWYTVLASLGVDSKTSMLQDVEAGRTTEVEMLAGTIIKLGKEQGVPTPVNQQLYDHLKRISLENVFFG